MDGGFGLVWSDYRYLSFFNQANHPFSLIWLGVKCAMALILKHISANDPIQWGLNGSVEVDQCH
jgi:hypothetical protein